MRRKERRKKMTTKCDCGKCSDSEVAEESCPDTERNIDGPVMPNTPLPRIICLYHGNCPDGAAASWVVREFYKKVPGANVEFHAVQYNDAFEPEDFRGALVYMVDFSVPPDTLKAIAAMANRVVVIDHHNSAIKKYRDTYQLQLPANCSTYMLDGICGAVLTWQWFFNSDAPEWLLYINDRDLWKWELHASKEVSAAIFARGLTHETFDEVHANARVDTLAAEGAAILRYQRQLLNNVKTRAKYINIDGHYIPAVVCPVLISEVADDMIEAWSVKAAAVFYQKPYSLQWMASLRSSGKSGLDVEAIAKAHGGGGHLNAAGCPAPQDWLVQLLGVV
jgi:oligoribonuclease NrnB/cAMP/cGMP phosphodiesterase (DHH superfamily)